MKILEDYNKLGPGGKGALGITIISAVFLLISSIVYIRDLENARQSNFGLGLIIVLSVVHIIFGIGYKACLKEVES